MFNPPEELHTHFDDALKKVKGNLGKEHAMIIGGEERKADEKFERYNPSNTDELLGVFQKGTEKDAADAINAARKAFPIWRAMKWQERIKLMRRVAELIDERIFAIGVIVALEVGKNRMEALGDVAETADLIRYACTQMEANEGFIKQMGTDPLQGFKAVNYSVLRPHGVWLIISPFNFPAALTGGPCGAALVAGNTIVIKPATNAPWTSRKLVECMRDAGLPDGAFNYVTGPGRTLGQALTASPEIDGITFTGSYDVGMHIFRTFAQGEYVRPTILELGGKNPAIVSRNADIEQAAAGIVRSAFGLQGQKCSACSRVYVEKPVYQKLFDRMIKLTKKISVGDPTERGVFLGPVINEGSYKDYQEYVDRIRKSGGRFLTGGKVLREGKLAKGYFCAPSLVADLPIRNRLWKHEMFVPIATIAYVDSIEKAMEYANDSVYGLTAGFYGSKEETQWFFKHIQAGVTYANRPQGATTGAWPGFQPFGGWKGSGTSGKNAGGLYYLQLYMHEQIQTLIERA